MKKIIISALIIAGMTVATIAISEAKTGPLICAFDHKSGDVVKYMFEAQSSDELHETGFMKNGHFLAHPQGDEPVWTAQALGDTGVVEITYLRDPRFSIILSDTKWSRDGKMLLSPARLIQDGKVVGTGRCGYERT